MGLYDSAIRRGIQLAEEELPKLAKKVASGAEEAIASIAPKIAPQKEIGVAPLETLAKPTKQAPEPTTLAPVTPEPAITKPAKAIRTMPEETSTVKPAEEIAKDEGFLTEDLVKSKLERGIEKEPISVRVPRNLQEMKSEFIDEFSPLDKDKIDNIYESKSPAYLQAQTFRDKVHYGYQEDHDKIFGEILKYNEKAGTGLKDRSEARAFDIIGSLKHLGESSSVGKTYGGMTKDVAEKRLEVVKKMIGEEKFNRISKTVDNFADFINDTKLNKIYRNNDEGIDLITGGVDDLGNAISADDLAKNWAKQHPHYMPIKMVEDALTEELPQSKYAGGDSTGFLKRRKGADVPVSTQYLQNNLEGLYRGRYAVQKIKLNNQIASEYGVEVGHAYPHGIKVTGEVPKGFQIVKMKTSSGKVYALPDNIADMVNNVNKQDIDIITGMHQRINKVFKLGATSARIAFSMMNPAKDLVDSIINERRLTGIASVYNPKNWDILAKAFAASFLHTFPGLEKYAKGEFLEKAVKLEKEAGKAGMYYGHRPDFAEMPFKFKSIPEKLGEAAYNTIVLPPAKLAEVGEAWLRLAQFARGQKGGYSPEFSSLLGKNITVNFAKMGHKGRVLNAMSPFLNPAVQGATNLVSNMKYDPVGTSFKIGAFLSAATSLYIYNKTHDTEDFKTVDPYLKDGFFLINSDIKDKNGKPVYLVMGSLPRIVDGAWAIWRKQLDLILEKDPKARELLKKYSSTYFQLSEEKHPFLGKAYNWASPVVQQTVSMAPPLYRLPVEALSNYDLWRQRNIVPPTKEGLSSELQSRESTSDIYRVLGEKTGTAPAIVEHIARGFFPANIQYEPLLDKMIEMAGIKPVEPQKTEEKSGYETLAKYIPYLRIGRTDPRQQMIYNIWKDRKKQGMDNLYMAKVAYDRMVSGDENATEDFNEAISKLSKQQITTLKKYAKDQYYKKQLSPVDYLKYRKLPKHLRGEAEELPEDTISF